ncbi:hypothetical protein SOVF_018080 [Spinacia oleracea]|nr:hypothetical protein SOVF_018080 [Spinacia oleracea]
MDMPKGDQLPSLPFDLLILILSCLPVKPLMRFKCVSKALYELINSQKFFKLHLNRSLQADSDGNLICFGYFSIHAFDFNGSPYHASKLYYPENIGYPRRLIGSCNGLVCFSFQADHLIIHNPATRAYKTLPNLPLTKKYCEVFAPIGFGYDCISDDYKVLQFAMKPSSGKIEYETLLYSWRTNAWEIIQNPPWNWDTVKLFPGILVNNSLHWMGCENKEIKCFNLSTKRYYEITLPGKISPGYSPTLGILRGQLAVVTYYLDIWILKEYGVQESWTRLFRCPSVEWNNLFDTLTTWHLGVGLTCSKDGSKILVGLAGGMPNFICCNLESKEARKIKISSFSHKLSVILPWVESLVPV